MKKFEWLIIGLLFLFGGIELGLFLWAIRDGNNRPVELLQIFSPLLLASVLGFYFKQYSDGQKRILEIGINSYLSKKIAEKRSQFYEEYLFILEDMRRLFLNQGTDYSSFEKEYSDLYDKLIGVRQKNTIWISSKIDTERLRDLEGGLFLNPRLEQQDEVTDFRKKLNLLFVDEEKFNREIRELMGTDQVVEMQKRVLDESVQELRKRQ